MKYKLTITTIALILSLSNLFSNDTIRYEWLKLEKIQVDTLIKIDTDNFIGCVNMQFSKGSDTIVNCGYVSLMAINNSAVKYYWTRKPSSLNFTLTKGLDYKIQLTAVCKKELHKSSFYMNYSSFAKDSCSLEKVFNKEIYQDKYEGKLLHYFHMNKQVYKVELFHPNMASTEIKKSGYNLDFIPVNLKSNK